MLSKILIKFGCLRIYKQTLARVLNEFCTIVIFSVMKKEIILKTKTKTKNVIKILGNKRAVKSYPSHPQKPCQACFLFTCTCHLYRPYLIYNVSYERIFDLEDVSLQQPLQRINFFFQVLLHYYAKSS